MVDPPNNSENFEESRLFPAIGKKADSVVMLLHGLNQKPSSWQDLIKVLTLSGFHVYRLTLKGHRGRGFQDMETVSSKVWLENFYCGYSYIRERFPRLPVLLAAYSLGALLALVAQLQSGRRLFAKQLLLAPALAIRPYTRVVLPFTKVFPWLPGRPLPRYQANRRGTSSAAYQALFQLAGEFRRYDNLQTINIPTCVIMRPDDELVSFKGTSRLMSDRDLSNWQLFPLPTAQIRPGRFLPRHVIVDEWAVGDTGWQWLAEKATFFLTGKANTLP